MFALKPRNNMKTLIQELNKYDFKAFPQKSNPKQVTLSVAGEDGHRYFLTRVATGQLQEDGTAIYQWARGNAMRPQQAPAPVAPITNTNQAAPAGQAQFETPVQ